MAKEKTPVDSKNESNPAKVKIQSSTRKQTVTSPRLSTAKPKRSKKTKPKPKKVVIGSRNLKADDSSLGAEVISKTKDTIVNATMPELKLKAHNPTVTIGTAESKETANPITAEGGSQLNEFSQ